MNSSKKILLLSLVLSILFVGFLFAGCVQQTRQPQEQLREQTSLEKTQIHYVTLSSDSASPKVLEIKKGDTVTWINQDPELTHLITFASDSSPELKQGESWSKTFNQRGTFNYGDGLYGMIEGTIIVK